MNAGIKAWLLGALSIGKEVARMLLHHPVTGVLAVPLDPTGRIVMMRRRDTGTWCIPGGSIEWGEPLREALRRELKEETGYSLIEIRHLVGIYSDPARDPRMHAITIVVEATVSPPHNSSGNSSGNNEVLNPLEVLDVKAFDRSALPTDLAFDTRRMLDDYLRGGPPVID